VVGGGGWGSAAPRSWLEGPLFDVGAAGGDRTRPRRGRSVRSIAAAIGCAPSTVSRELRRNADRLGGYRATTAHALAYARASRPKTAKLVTNLVLRGKVEADLAKKYSPEQIAGRLKVDFPDQPEMQVSTETIYQSLYVQSRGALRRDLTRHPTTGSGQAAGLSLSGSLCQARCSS
jgi:IS30 family transposase